MASKDTIIPDKITFKDDMYAYINIERPAGTDRLPCYGTVFDEENKEVSCWVASEKYRNFRIFFRNNAYPSCSICVTLYLDGQEIQCRRFWAYEDQRFTFSALKTSLYQERPFMFAPLDVTDDTQDLDSFAASMANWKKVGKISLEVRRITDILPKPGTKPTETALTGDFFEEFGDIPQVQRFNRKCFQVEMIPHQIVYGDRRRVNYNKKPDVIKKPGTVVKERIVTLTFRYRPIEYIRQSVLPSLSTGTSKSAHQTEDGHQSTSSLINPSTLRGYDVAEGENDPTVNQVAVEDNVRAERLRLPIKGKRKSNITTDNLVKRVRVSSPST